MEQRAETKEKYPEKRYTKLIPASWSWIKGIEKKLRSGLVDPQRPWRMTPTQRAESMNQGKLWPIPILWNQNQNKHQVSGSSQTIWKISKDEQNVHRFHGRKGGEESTLLTTAFSRKTFSNQEEAQKPQFLLILPKTKQFYSINPLPNIGIFRVYFDRCSCGKANFMCNKSKRDIRDHEFVFPSQPSQSLSQLKKEKKIKALPLSNKF